jgi:hypothetical protein
MSGCPRSVIADFLAPEVFAGVVTGLCPLEARAEPGIPSYSSRMRSVLSQRDMSDKMTVSPSCNPSIT